MIFEKERIKVDKLGKKDFIIFDYYDGVKGEYNLKEGIILFWHDYGENGEFWFCIKTDKSLIKKFLKNKIPALELFKNKNSEVSLYERPYENYNELKFIKDLTKEELKEYEIPTENSYLGYDFESTYKKEKDKFEEIEIYLDYDIDIFIMYSKTFSIPEKAEFNEDIPIAA